MHLFGIITYGDDALSRPGLEVVHTTIGHVGISHAVAALNLNAPPRLMGVHRGNDRGMEPVEPDESTRALWADAAAAVQADHDVDVRLEALGLAIAEMADVSFVERFMAMDIGSNIKVAQRSRRWVSGCLVDVGPDFIVLRDVRELLLPVESVVAIESVPRVLHQDRATQRAAAASRTRRSLMREILGHHVQVSAHGFDFTGCLTWVGADHITVTDSIGLTGAAGATIPWSHIDVVTLPGS